MCTFSVTFSAIPVFIIDFSREEADALKGKRGFLPPRLSGPKRSNIHVPIHAMVRNQTYSKHPLILVYATVLYVNLGDEKLFQTNSHF